MPNDREKLLNIMSSLESDYKSGKISAEKYSYFRSKYEDKLNEIDALAATRRIRSMQGKPSNNNRKKKRKKPTKNAKQENQDLVQKYIIDPKKGDAKYDKKPKSQMDSGTFKLLLLLVLVIGFTCGVAYGIFNFDFETLSETDTVAIVEDTAFPEINAVVPTNTTTTTQTTNTTTVTTDDTNDDNNDVEDTQTTNDQSSSPSRSSSSSGGSQSGSGSSSSDSGGSTSTSGSSDSGSSSSGGGSSSGGASSDSGGSSEGGGSEE